MFYREIAFNQSMLMNQRIFFVGHFKCRAEYAPLPAVIWYNSPLLNRTILQLKIGLS